MPGPRKPIQLKVLAGTRRPDRDPPQAELEAPKIPGEVDPPDWLSTTHAIKYWRRVQPMLSRNGLLTEANLDPLSVLCEVYGQIVDNATRKNQVTGSLLTQYRALANDFGLTPASQGRVLFRGEAPKKNRFSGIGKRK